MSSSKKLEFQAMKYIDDSYLSGDREIEDEKLEDYIEDFPVEADMKKVDEVLQKAIEDYDSGDAKMDPFVAKEIHKAISITRRQAAEPRFWNYMSLIFKPEFVRHRWPSYSRNRFIMRTSNGRHALARLWWIAELTEQEGDYKYTEIAFSKQDIAQNIFDNDFSHFEELLPPVLDRLDNEPSKVATKFGELLNRKFAVLLEEDMEADQLEELSELVRVQARKEAGFEVENEKSTLSKYKEKGKSLLK